MKRLLALVVAIACMVCMFAGCAKKGYKADSVIMTVDGEKVYEAEYRFLYALYAFQYNLYYGEEFAGMDTGDGTTLGQQISDYALDSTEAYKIQYIKAKKEYGIKVNSKEFKETAQQQKKIFVVQAFYDGEEDVPENYTDDPALYEKLYKETYDKFKEQFLDVFDVEDKAVDTLFEWSEASVRLIDAAVPVSEIPDSDIQADFLDRYWKAKHILIKTNDDAEAGDVVTEEQALARANEALAKIEAGTSFEDVAKEYNEDPGEDIETGYIFTEGDMVPEFEEATKNLEIDAYTKAPVKTDYGYHIVKRYDFTEEDKNEYKKEFQSSKYSEMVEKWIDEANTEKKDDIINAFTERNVKVEEQEENDVLPPENEAE